METSTMNRADMGRWQGLLAKLIALAAALAVALALAGCAGGASPFSIEGTWKNTGSGTFGQVQPGAIVVFDGKNCNVFSPGDSYAFYQEGGEYRLDVVGLLGGNPSFAVTVNDNDHIVLTYGTGTAIELMRVSKNVANDIVVAPAETFANPEVVDASAEPVTLAGKLQCYVWEDAGNFDRVGVQYFLKFDEPSFIEFLNLVGLDSSRFETNGVILHSTFVPSDLQKREEVDVDELKDERLESLVGHHLKCAGELFYEKETPDDGVHMRDPTIEEFI